MQNNNKIKQVGYVIAVLHSIWKMMMISNAMELHLNVFSINQREKTGHTHTHMDQHLFFSS